MIFDLWVKNGKSFQEGIAQLFESLAFVTTRNPIKILFSTFVFIILCSLGFFNFRQVSRGEDLWTPRTSDSVRDLKHVEDNYGQFSSGGQALFVADNIVDLNFFEQMWDVQDQIAAFAVDGQVWDDICFTKDFNGNCFANGPLQFWSNNRTLYNEAVVTKDDLIDSISAAAYPNGIAVSRDQVFGNIEVDNSNRIIAAEGSITSFVITGDEDLVMDWQQGFLNVAADQDIVDGNLYYFSGRSWDDEMSKSVNGDIMLMVITYLIMITFTCIVMTKQSGELFKTRTGLSLCGTFFTVMAIVAGYGLCSGLGVPFNTLHSILPFIVIGIGVDDMFVITFSFDHQSAALPNDVRLANALKQCGLSITYTTATDVAAFLLGATSSLPAIQQFCFYAAVTLLFNFVFQLTAYSVLLVWDEERQQKGNLDVLFCCNWYPPTELSAVSKSAGPLMVASPQKSPVGKDVLGTKGFDSVHTTVQHEPEELDSLQHFLGNVYYPIISNFNVRVAITIAFVALLGVNMYGTSNITQGFDFSMLVPDDSYAKVFITEAKRLHLFNIESTVPVSIYFQDLPYHEQQIQERILMLQDDFIAIRHNSGPYESWVSDFIPWVSSDQSPYNTSVNANNFLTDETLFYEAVEYFVLLPEYNRFERDIVFSYNTNGSVHRIQDSRVSAYHKELTEPMIQVHAMDNSRKICKDAGFEPAAFPFTFPYIFYETEAIIVREMYENLLMALGAVAAVSSLVLILPRAVLVVCILLCVIDTDILGTMFFWGLTINTVTVVQLVMAVGLVVDYVAHILHYYLAQPQHLSNGERVRLALIGIGPSVLMGCMTTFLGILPLAFANSAIFRIFFRMFFSIIVFGAGHGLILLPVILPWIPFGDEEEGEKEGERYDQVPNSPIPLKGANRAEMEMAAVPRGDVRMASEVDAYAVVAAKDEHTEL